MKASPANQKLGLVVAFFVGVLAALVLQNAFNPSGRMPASTTIIHTSPTEEQGEVARRTGKSDDESTTTRRRRSTRRSRTTESSTKEDSSNQPDIDDVVGTKCKKNVDCSLPTTICEKKRCAALESPIVCTCSQPQVLRCSEKESNKAKYTFCENRCKSSRKGAECR